jgi:hypothetical protein
VYLGSDLLIDKNPVLQVLLLRYADIPAGTDAIGQWQDAFLSEFTERKEELGWNFEEHILVGLTGIYYYDEHAFHQLMATIDIIDFPSAESVIQSMGPSLWAWQINGDDGAVLYCHHTRAAHFVLAKVLICTFPGKVEKSEVEAFLPLVNDHRVKDRCGYRMHIYMAAANLHCAGCSSSGRFTAMWALCCPVLRS